MKKDKLAEKIIQAVTQYAMIPDKGKIIVGVSGGADSMAMLHFLMHFVSKDRLLVCHVNHGIRGEEAQRDENFVREYCKGNSLSFRVCKTDVPALAKTRGLSEEECGREERYRFFSSFISSSEDRIATAHTKTDLVETILFRLATGSALRGLTGISPVRGIIIRPMITLSREETQMYCDLHGVPFVVDSTNASTKYVRNYIRAEILPKFININSNYEDRIASFAESVSKDEAFLSEIAKEASLKASTSEGYDTNYCLTLKDPILMRVLRMLAEENGAHRITEKQLEHAKCVLRKGGIAEFTGGIDLIAGQGRFRFLKKENLSGNIAFSAVFSCEGPLFFPNGVFEAKIIDELLNVQKKDQKINNLLFTKAIDYDIITHDLVVRTRRSGDYFVSCGNSVRKSLRKFLSEKKVPIEKRDQLILIANGNEVLFLEGFGPSEQAKVSDKTKKAVLISIKREV